MVYYFLGIGGSAMGQAALLLKNQGHTVYGADLNVYAPMSDQLQVAGIAYEEGYSVEALKSKNPDYIIVGNVMSRGNPIVEWLLEHRSIPYLSLPELIGQCFIKNRPSLVIAGTHGKTTTTAAAAYLLSQLGQAPGYILGGVPHDLPYGNALGNPESPFVIEGDEYDSAFFDKRGKYVHYRPHVLVLNNLEFDHADIFRDLEDIQRSFNHVTRLVPRNGCILYKEEEPALQSLLPVSWAPCYSVGMGPQADLRIADLEHTAQGIHFSLIWQNQYWTRLATQLHGSFNARNLAMAALAVAWALSPKDPTQINPATLQNFRGVKRRQEVRHQDARWTVIEDFAHHPTAVAMTLQAIRKCHPQARIHALFEPRSNTTAGKSFEALLPEALCHADHVYIAPAYRSSNLAPQLRLDAQAICQSIQAQSHGNTQAQAFNCFDSLFNTIQAVPAQTGPHVAVFLSNGAFGNILPKFIASLNA